MPPQGCCCWASKASCHHLVPFLPILGSFLPGTVPWLCLLSQVCPPPHSCCFSRALGVPPGTACPVSPPCGLHSLGGRELVMVLPLQSPGLQSAHFCGMNVSFSNIISVIQSWCTSQPSCLWDTIPDAHDLKEEGFNVAHSLGGFSSWKTGSKVQTLW